MEVINMRKSVLFFFSVLICSLLLCGCGKVFNYDITTVLDKTTIKVLDAGDNAYGESSPIEVGKNRVLQIESALEKGKLKIDFAEVTAVGSSDTSDDYIVGDVVESITLSPQDKMELSLESGDYLLQMTTIGETKGTITIEIVKKS